MFLGLGGAGQRHLRIFRALLPDARLFAFRSTGKTPALNADFSVAPGASLEDRYGIRFVPRLEDAYALHPDLVVISLPTALQAAAIKQAAAKRCDIFVEKPAVASVDEAAQVESAVRAAGVDFFVSFQRRFHPVVQRLREIIGSGQLGELLSVRVSVSSYVPDWHRYEDFRTLYACRADLGGGVLRTESHEMDILGWLFGTPRTVTGMVGLRGGVQMDVEDSADLLLGYDRFTAHVGLCFMDRRPERKITVHGRNGWLTCDLNAQRLESGSNAPGDARTESFDSDSDTTFTSQARYFLNEFETGSTEYLDSIKRLSGIIAAAEAGSGSFRRDAGN